jgi:hypothetical protein
VQEAGVEEGTEGAVVTVKSNEEKEEEEVPEECILLTGDETKKGYAKKRNISINEIVSISDKYGYGFLGAEYT